MPNTMNSRDRRVYAATSDDWSTGAQILRRMIDARWPGKRRWWHEFAAPSFALIYRRLERMEADGLVETRVVECTGTLCRRQWRRVQGGG